MRVILGLSTSAAVVIASSTSTALNLLTPPSCQDVCDSVKECVPKGSYCKISRGGDNFCYGLYFRDIARTKPCFADDPTCPQAIPVRCPTTPPPSPSTITCENICGITAACAFSPTNQGTYCDKNLPIPACFGLFWRDLAETQPCYWQADATCPQVDPIRCG
jgi:hypothetical protein